MKLQINDTGAWRNVLSFKPEKKEAAMVHAERLAECSAGVVKLQIINADRQVVDYWTPETGWK